MSDLQQIMDAHDIKTIEDISTEYGVLMDWFQKQWPEARIRLEVNSDQRDGTLNYKLSVLTGKEMSPGNQGYWESVIRINRSRFTDLSFMDAFKRSIVPNYKKSITERMNQHYHTEKEKSEAKR